MKLSIILVVKCLFLLSYFGAYNSITTTKAVFHQEWLNARPRLVMRGTLPAMLEFTICYWVDSYIGKSGIRDTSYITTFTNGDNTRRVVHTGFEYVKSEIYFMLSFEDLKAYMMDGNATFKWNLDYSQWHHLCVSWSTGGRVNFYLNGVKMGASNNVGTALATGGKLIIGDGVPNANVTLGWLGNIADLQIWDEPLHENQIKSLAKCKDKLEGNIFAWMKTSLSAYDGVILTKANKLCVH